MAKFLRTKGTSYTKRVGDGDQASIRRGVQLKRDPAIAFPGIGEDNKVGPDLLAAFLAADPDLALRQVISVLDKTISKPRDLSGFEYRAYLERTRLAAALWTDLENALAKVSFEGDSAEKIAHLRRAWTWKAHPYAWGDVDDTNPERDKNGVHLFKHPAEGRERADFEGRWHEVFWVVNQYGEPEFAAIAKRMLDHLQKSEFNIAKKPKVETGKRGKARTGLIEARGNSMVHSAQDPRAKPPQDRVLNWLEADEVEYFYDDVAARIFEFATREDRNSPIYSSDFGAELYEHFGVLVGKKEKYSEAQYKRIWALHNAVRKFYRLLARSERFRKAVRDKNLDEIRNLVPEDQNALLKVLGAKRRNADISKLIRLGKLVVHGSDLPYDTPNPDEDFAARVEHLVTSDGQSEIKRNEAFARVWRNAMGFSQRTLRVWATADETIRAGDDDDLSQPAVSKAAVGSAFNPKHYTDHLGILFGDKEIDACGGTSRSSIFQGTETESREVLWAFLRLGAGLRNRSNHFSIMSRLTELVERGVVAFEENPKGFDNRAAHVVAGDASKKFGALLSFDKVLKRQALLDELELIEFGDFVPSDKSGAVLAELAKSSATLQIAAPRFMSVMHRVADLSKSDTHPVDPLLKPLASLSLSSPDLSQPGPNKFKVGVLRKLYRTGFLEWLDAGLPVGEDSTHIQLQHIVDQVVRDKKVRTEKTLQDNGWVHAHADVVSEDLEFDKVSDLNSLLKGLLVRSMSEERLGQTYRPSGRKVSDVANRVERFKQELFASLFSIYLGARGFDWVFQVSERIGTPGGLSLDDIVSGEIWEQKDWHASFYAWLYLVPSDEVARLRHQFIKTRVLEGDGDPAMDSTLDELDKLMDLYAGVQSAGFSGREHVAALNAGASLYESSEVFDKVYSDEMEHHHISFPGTRRGLRQIVRFGHLEVLKGIYKKHPITNAEVDVFTTQESAVTKAMFDRKIELRDEIILGLKQAKKGKEEAKDWDKRKNDLFRTYKSTACEIALYNFQTSGARLSDHARLHHLMMRVVGRLMDYTLIWERDVNYLFLGLLYRQLQEAGHKLGLVATTDAKNGPGLALVLQDKALADAGTDPDVLLNGALPIWNEKLGFALPKFNEISNLLSADSRKIFDRVSDMLETENQKDIDANREKDEEGKTVHHSQYQVGRRQIRNDFAHYNVVSENTYRGRDRRLNLTFRINAVRSLLNYDRKLKNAVSKSIKKILASEGLDIAWEMREDRLRHPRVTPLVEEHLKMVPKSQDESARFHLPSASVRYTSMVKALFDFDSGGYRMFSKTPKGRKRVGALMYPDAFLGEDRYSVPDVVRGARFGELGSERW